jgi:hypothetical protein
MAYIIDIFANIILDLIYKGYMVYTVNSIGHLNEWVVVNVDYFYLGSVLFHCSHSLKM